jgi:hypothetical protein
LISQANAYRARRHAPWQASRTILHRLEALLCLLIIMAQLVLVVAHSWEIALEEGAISVTRASRAFLRDARGTTAIAKAATVPRRNAHDPLLCPLCQLLSQARHGLAPHGPGMLLPQTCFPVLPDSSCYSASLDLAVSAPRAPPSFL